MKLGKAKYSGEKKEIFKIKDGDNVYRILPPMGKLAEKGVFSRYFRVVWGYKDSKGQNRPFISPRVQNFNTRMVEVDCAAFNRAEKLKAEFKIVNEALKALKLQAQALVKAGQPLTDELKKGLANAEEAKKEAFKLTQAFNVESKYHLNAIAQDGKIGLLKLAGRGFKPLKKIFKDLEADSIDATGVENGRFMVINRQGTGLDTDYAVTELKVKVNTAEHGVVEKSQPHVLTTSIISRLAAEAFELDEIYPAPTEAEVKEIVEAFESSPEVGGAVIDRLFGERDAKKEEPAKETVVETKVESKVSDHVNMETGEILETAVDETVAEEVIVEEVVIEKTPANPAAESDQDFLDSLNLG
jgi:hypothetical protein